ncbi:polysaccharide pyruvyl transferase family protein [Providencia rettgeri]|uniref:polysaccharide pyruvyl transferase family protein n=1 Tax=Providencia rettgeri TaxID=587 RepID=UPI001E3E1E64|nr:polysaccharide pyruvyl transferase family protein [Providencia rettgeri]
MNIKNNILIINEGNSDNLGDKAIKQSAVAFYTEENTNLSFSDYTKVNEIHICNDQSKSKGKRNFLKNLLPYKLRWLILNYSRVRKVAKKKYNLVSIGGGQLILSNETFSIALFTWISLLYLSGNKNIILLSVGVGDKFTFLDKLLFNFSLKRIQQIYVRDSRSEKNLKSNFNLDSIKTFDIAFFHANKKIKSNEDYSLLGVTDYNVYIKYNPKITRDEYYNSWIKIIKTIPQNSCIKLFYTTQSDYNECLIFQKYCQTQYNIKYDILPSRNLIELNEILIKAERVISGRMHALILAHNLNKHIITYPISSKLSAFNDEIILSKLDSDFIQKNLESMRSAIFDKYIK